MKMEERDVEHNAFETKVKILVLAMMAAAAVVCNVFLFMTNIVSK